MIRITEIRFDPGNNANVVAYVHVTLDNSLVVHDLRIIRKTDPRTGRDVLFLAFPSKKRGVRCPNCGAKNPFTDQFCGSCGSRFDGESLLPEPEDQDRPLAHHDIVHPIGPRTRQYFEREIIGRYLSEQQG